MEKELGVTEACQQFASIIAKVRYQGDNYIIVSHGQPAAVVPISVYRQWQAERQELFEVIRCLQRANSDVDADQVMQEVLKAQREVRQA